MAIVSVLLAGVLLLASGLATSFMANTELAISLADRLGQEAMYAAEGAAHAEVAEIAGDAEWGGVLDGSRSSAFRDATLTPRIDGTGLVVDLTARTMAVQAASDAMPGGADRSQWRLFAWGPASMLLSPPASIGPFYLAVWFADDSGDGDGNPSVDANGIVIVHAEAYGPGGVLRAVECVVSRAQTTGSRPALLSWRELRPI
jgi:hypothetical protein